MIKHDVLLIQPPLKLHRSQRHIHKAERIPPRTS